MPPFNIAYRTTPLTNSNLEAEFWFEDGRKDPKRSAASVCL